MILALTTSWNSTMTIGAIIAVGGVGICLTVLIVCFIRMSLILSATKSFFSFGFFFPFAIYREFKHLAKTTSEMRKKYTRHLQLIDKSLIVAPIVLMLGLLIMVIGKSLLD